jgi:CRP-like cAMP-binding protein
MMTDVERCAGSEGHQPEPRNLEIVSVELQGRLDEASKALQKLKVQQATFGALLARFQADLDAALALSREMKELAEYKREAPSGLMATIQAAVEKTRETVADQVEHARERAVAALHRVKGKDGG